MAYKTSNNNRIQDDKSIIVKNLNATTIRRLYSGLGDGTSNGYASGGYVHPPYTGYSKVEKFAFAASSNATNVGNLLTQARYSMAGSTSTTHCYNAGGNTIPFGAGFTTIDKFPFSADTNATDVGDLTLSRISAGSTDRIGGHGYALGGTRNAGAENASNVIDKFPFSSDTNATDVGDLTQSRGYAGDAAQSSTTHGYLSGGYIPNTGSGYNTIDKFSFTAGGNATDVGDLTQARYSMDGTSSSTHGYNGGGYIFPGNSYPNILDKYPFATDANAADVGDMTVQKSARAGISSETHGYGAGGSPGIDTIDRYPFSSDGNAADVGNLSTPTVNSTGNQG